MPATTRRKAEKREKDVTKSEILLYIYSHLNEKLTLKQLSQLFHMSDNSISST